MGTRKSVPWTPEAIEFVTHLYGHYGLSVKHTLALANHYKLVRYYAEKSFNGCLSVLRIKKGKAWRRKKIARAHLREAPWSPEEKALLADLRGRGRSFRQCLEYFPGRTREGLVGCAHRNKILGPNPQGKMTLPGQK